MNFIISLDHIWLHLSRLHATLTLPSSCLSTWWFNFLWWRLCLARNSTPIGWSQKGETIGQGWQGGGHAKDMVRGKEPETRCPRGRELCQAVVVGLAWWASPEKGLPWSPWDGSGFLGVRTLVLGLWTMLQALFPFRPIYVWCQFHLPASEFVLS